jgi:RNA polymerase sigma-70 factor, ECF subfamily
VKSRNPDGPTIEALVEQLRGGTRREESFRLLFDRYHWPLVRFFEGRGFSTEECQDLVQETFLRAYRGIEGFRGDSLLGHWLFRIAHNTSLKALRRGATAKRAGATVSWEETEGEGSLPVPPHGAETPAPLRRLLTGERRELLSQAIAGLPAQMRRCVRLRVFQDLDYAEIAEVLQISPSTVKVQMFKARKRLQVELEDALIDFDL